MSGRHARDPVLDVVADFILAGLIKQRRFERVIGDAAWAVDLDEGWWRIGEAQGRLDVVGTVGGEMLDVTAGEARVSASLAELRAAHAALAPLFP